MVITGIPTTLNPSNGLYLALLWKFSGSTTPSIFISTTTKSASIPSFRNPLLGMLNILAGFSASSCINCSNESFPWFIWVKRRGSAVSSPGIPGGAFQTSRPFSSSSCGACEYLRHLQAFNPFPDSFRPVLLIKALLCKETEDPPCYSNTCTSCPDPMLVGFFD